jgi:hypothetical protein
MDLLTNLLFTDYGMASLAVIVFVLGMSVFFYSFAKRHIQEDAKKAGE